MTLEDLKLLAEGATPGPWEFTKAYGVRSETSKNEVGEYMPICAETCFSVGEYIAAANPRVVLALIEVAKAAHGMFDEDGLRIDHHCPGKKRNHYVLRDSLKKLDEVLGE